MRILPLTFLDKMLMKARGKITSDMNGKDLKDPYLIWTRDLYMHVAL